MSLIFSNRLLKEEGRNVVNAAASSAGRKRQWPLKQTGWVKSMALLPISCVTLGSRTTLSLNFLITNLGSNIFITTGKILCKNNHQY